MKIDWRAVRRYDANTRAMRKARKYEPKQSCITMTMCVVEDKPVVEHLEKRGRMFSEMQGRRFRKHGARGGMDKTSEHTIISTKHFNGTRLTCVYRHKAV